MSSDFVTNMLLPLVLTGAVVLLFRWFAIFVPAGARKVIMSNLDGSVVVLDRGVHLFYPPLLYARYVQSPFQGMMGGGNMSPAPGIRLRVDPPKANITTKDKINGVQNFLKESGKFARLKVALIGSALLLVA